MSPNASLSLDTSEYRAAPNPNDADAESNTSALHLSSSHNNGVQEPESSNASVPPPYTKNTPLDDPFRDGHAPVGYFYPNNNGMQKGLQPAIATHEDPPPAAMAILVDPVPPVPTDAADPFAAEMVLDESLPPPPPLPPGPSGLSRGLQIPSRFSIITWGFSFPTVLAEQGVTKPHWNLFKRELKTFASMSKLQWVTVIACHVGVSHFFGLIAGVMVGYKMHKHREQKNFLLAYQSGVMKGFEDRWNNDYFHPLGLHVRIEPPGVGEMNDMDVTSTKLFRYQQKMGTSSPAPGVASKQGDKREYRYQYKEGRYRMKAARKGRIIVLPFNMVKLVPSQPRTTDSDSHNGQSEGTTPRARPSVQDFASLNQRQSGSEGLYRIPTNAQHLASSQQRPQSLGGLYRGDFEADAERAPSPARIPTTHWGGNR